MWNLILQIASGILGLWLADRFVSGVTFNGPIFYTSLMGISLDSFLNTLTAAGTFLGLLNFFVKPILNTIALPLRIITLNLFSLIIAMALIWVVEILFPNLAINGIIPLFWTTLIVWLLNFFLTRWLPNKSNK